MLIAEQTNGLFILVLGFGLITMLVAMRSVRRIAGHASRRKSEALNTSKQTAATLGPPDAFRQWEVELHELGRELQARLDNKIAILEHLIQTASAESDRLERALSAARQEQIEAPR